MKPLTASEVERLLMANGYVLHRVCGSHYIWKNIERKHSVPVPHHGNATPPPFKRGVSFIQTRINVRIAIVIIA